MDYERIHKVKMGVISPSKLRMKLLGAHNSKKKEGGSQSSRTSPSKLVEMEYAKNHLLTSELDEEASSDSKPVASSEDSKLELCAKEQCDTSLTETQVSRSLSYQNHHVSNLSTVHPVRSLDEGGNGYDSGHDNGSTSSFEFHRGERSVHHSAVGPLYRHVPSKWNDAEKWIVNRQAPNTNASKKNMQQVQGSRQINSGWMRLAPDSMISETKRVDAADRPLQNVAGKFFFVPNCLNAMGESTDSSQVCTDFAQQATIQKEKDHKEVAAQEEPIAETAVISTVESVSMRDVGTEMTPIPSQDPSRTGTPLGATTPSRSPISSMPSTPKRGGDEPSCAEASTADGKDCQKGGCKRELSEKELQLKTRREIAALGIQLGKMNIASWASKNEAEHLSPSGRTVDIDKQVKADYEARAAAWEEIEKAKHLARYKQEEVKIQAWESHQRAKFEAKMRKVEVQLEQMRIQAQEKIAEKLAVTRRIVEDQQADAEARKNQRAAQTAQQVEQICQTGRVPPSHVRCWSWVSSKLQSTR